MRTHKTYQLRRSYSRPSLADKKSIWGEIGDPNNYNFVFFDEGERNIIALAKTQTELIQQLKKRYPDGVLPYADKNAFDKNSVRLRNTVDTFKFMNLTAIQLDLNAIPTIAELESRFKEYCIPEKASDTIIALDNAVNSIGYINGTWEQKHREMCKQQQSAPQSNAASVAAKNGFKPSAAQIQALMTVDTKAMQSVIPSMRSTIKPDITAEQRTCVEYAIGIYEKKANGGTITEQEAEAAIGIVNGNYDYCPSAGNREGVENGIDVLCRITKFNPVSLVVGIAAGGGVGYAIYSSRAKQGNTSLKAPIFLGLLTTSVVQTLGNYLLNEADCKGVGKAVFSGVEQTGKEVTQELKQAVEAKNNP
jgi:hypothetical protein